MGLIPTIEELHHQTRVIAKELLIISHDDIFAYQVYGQIEYLRHCYPCLSEREEDDVSFSSLFVAWYNYQWLSIDTRVIYENSRISNDVSRLEDLFAFVNNYSSYHEAEMVSRYIPKEILQQILSTKNKNK